MVDLLQNFVVNVQLPITLQCDSQAAISIAKNQVLHEQMKHVELDLHFVRDPVAEGFITIPYVHTSLQVADLFTKPKSYQYMAPFLCKMNLLSTQAFSGQGGGVRIIG